MLPSFINSSGSPTTLDLHYQKKYQADPLTGIHVPQHTSPFSTYLTFLFSYSREEACKLTSSLKHHAHSSSTSLCALRINFHEITYREEFN
jgi:hypothetical protein